jgi:hypothetical protein
MGWWKKCTGKIAPDVVCDMQLSFIGLEMAGENGDECASFIRN